jgi:hypothetical protein
MRFFESVHSRSRSFHISLAAANLVIGTRKVKDLKGKRVNFKFARARPVKLMRAGRFRPMVKILHRKNLLLFAALMFLCAFAPSQLAIAANNGEDESGERESIAPPVAPRPGTITGIVRDNQGRPLAGAIISLLRDAGEELVRQTRSGGDGSFAVRIAPGRYILRVVAEGFTTAAFSNVEVGSSAELVYRFDLIPAGQGRTAPEQTRNRNDSRFTLRSAHRRRSIFQANEHDPDLQIALERIEQEANETEISEIIAAAGQEDAGRNTQASGRAHGLVETYYAASSGMFAPPHAGVNFAFIVPARRNLNLVFAGQTGTAGAPQRFEASARARFGERHRLNVGVAGARLSVQREMNADLSTRENNAIQPSGENLLPRHLGQISARVAEEMTLPRGVVVVLGFDYARFLGAGNEHAFVPRFGVQFDADARTRLRANYASAAGIEETRTENVGGIENGAISFSEPSNQPIVFEGERAAMERSRRFEFGIERVLDERSSIEATVFFDTTDGRGVGLMSLPLSAFANYTGLTNIVEQQGAARGLRVVYARRLTSAIKASAGYSFGRGQRLAPSIDLTNSSLELQPDDIFQNGFFQTAAAQVDADVREGTRVRAVLRFSSRATVFAIDPFAGRLAVYDPSLSLLITQELPTFGLPVRAEAIIDARNLFDTGASAEDDDSVLIVGNTRRSVRGGIAVRF